MRGSVGNLLLKVLGALCAAGGLVTWVALAWTAFTQPDVATPRGSEGGRLLGWALVGTIVMIVGMILLHVAAQAAERGGHDDGAAPGS